MAEKSPNAGPYSYAANNPIIYKDPDGRDIVYFNSEGVETSRIVSNKVFKTYVEDGNIDFTRSNISYTEAPMPNIIKNKGNSDTTSPAYQKFDYEIAAQTFIFNKNKNNGITPTHTNGKLIEDPSTIPDLDPTLVKAIIMRETNMGTDNSTLCQNCSFSDIMQSNVYYNEKSNDWSDSKKQFGLSKGKTPSPRLSIKAGIGILYQKGLETNDGKTLWDGGSTWENATQKYNNKFKDYSKNVFEMKNNSTKPTKNNY